MYLQINTVKYDADWEITNTYENLQIVWSQFLKSGSFSLKLPDGAISNLNFGEKQHSMLIQSLIKYD